MAQAALVGLMALSKYREGQAQGDAQQYNADVASGQARVSQAQAEWDAKQQDRQNRLLLGQAVAAGGASGTAQSGSVLDVIADLAKQGEMAKARIRYQGAVAAQGYESTAALDRASAANARSAATVGASTDLLSAAYDKGWFGGGSKTPVRTG